MHHTGEVDVYNVLKTTVQMAGQTMQHRIGGCLPCFFDESSMDRPCNAAPDMRVSTMVLHKGNDGQVRQAVYVSLFAER